MHGPMRICGKRSNPAESGPVLLPQQSRNGASTFVVVAAVVLVSFSISQVFVKLHFLKRDDVLATIRVFHLKIEEERVRTISEREIEIERERERDREIER